MIDFPETLNTKQDYLNCLELYPQKTKEKLLELVNNRYSWLDTRILTDGEIGISDETHRVIECEDEKIQQEYKEDENSRIFQLGFSIEEVETLIN